MAKSIKAIIWDMGGVLLRTENKQPRKELAEESEITYEVLDQVVFNSESAQQAELGLVEDLDHWKVVAKTLGLDEEKLPGFIEKFWSGDQLDMQLHAWIHSLRDLYRIGLLSNAWKGTRLTLLSRYPNFFDPFHTSIFSAEVGLRKPDAQIFALILKEMNVKAEQAVFVDDFDTNIVGAKTAGLQAIQFKTTQQVIKDLCKLLDGGRID